MDIEVNQTVRSSLKVRGTVIAGAESSPDSEDLRYSGSDGHSQTVRIIQSVEGEYVVAVDYHHLREEEDMGEVAVRPSVWECLDYLVNRIPGWMLNQLIRDLKEAKEID